MIGDDKQIKSNILKSNEWESSEFMIRLCDGNKLEMTENYRCDKLTIKLLDELEKIQGYKIKTFILDNFQNSNDYNICNYHLCKFNKTKEKNNTIKTVKKIKANKKILTVKNNENESMGFCL